MRSNRGIGSRSFWSNASRITRGSSGARRAKTLRWGAGQRTGEVGDLAEENRVELDVDGLVTRLLQALAAGRLYFRAVQKRMTRK